VYRHLLLNFPLWTRAEIEVQHQFMNVLTRHIVKAPQQFKGEYGVQFLLDMLRTYYWYTENPLTFKVTQVRYDMPSNHHYTSSICYSFCVRELW